ncbi:MAG: hypothetical protein M1833_002937 [Piccolia ochrophora]|nr:MAG: hypothetical protein M1833_002937 [Piccolia ochrophora]
MSHPQAQPQMQHQAPHPHPQQSVPASPRQKVPQTPMQRPPSGPGASAQTTPAAPPANSNNMQANAGQGGPGVNPNAAPGPIPATTPLVVRQDNNGVQWIAFEYSRDRVKMEYTIRCDVESVNVDNLSQEFKTENCVYPRACCPKDQYRGNRLSYESECNTVGWALAELNPPLRGKRGLIQRAVDSWRNSNQDPRLRSRRVRRMAKINTRKAVQASQQHQNHMAGPSGPAPAAVPSAGTVAPAAMKPALSMSGSQLHHHHAHPDGNPPGGTDDVSANGDFHEGQTHNHPQAPNGSTGTSSTGVRHRQLFRGYAPNYPTPPNVAGAAMPPLTYDGTDHLGAHHPSNTSAIATSTPTSRARDVDLFGDVPESKRRKFILVDDPHRGSRVRVRVMLDQVETNEIPDSYRKTNSVFPRSYFPVQMQSPSASSRARGHADDADEDSSTELGQTFVRVPTLDGSTMSAATSRIRGAQRKKEDTLNDLGYRMSWSQSRVFAGRTLFLQKALDAYRNKMRSAMDVEGSDVAAVAPHFETRVGKRKWSERSQRPQHAPSP